MFFCNNKFKTCKQLKAHVQKKCKTDTLPKSRNNIVHKHNDDILTEDEHKCPHCSKITNNQVSLLNHVNTVHMVTKEKCDTCVQKFSSREDLVQHLVENHTEQGIQQTQHRRQGVQQVRVQGGLQGRAQGKLQSGPQGGLQGGAQGYGEQHQQGEIQWLLGLKCQYCEYECNTQNELEFHKESMHQQVISKNWCHRCSIEVNWDAK